MHMKFKYEELLPHEFLDAVKRMPVFFVPTGLLEWHADHLPLGQDALKAHGICLRTAEKLGGGIVLPPNYYGRPGFSRYTGTLTFSEGCLDTLFTELFYQLKKVGARVIVLLTGHYGECQVDFIKRVSAYFMRENPDVRIIAQPEYEGVLVDGKVPADHAGIWETSMFWHFYPDLTHMEKFLETPEPMLKYENPPHDFYKENAEWNWDQDVLEGSSQELGARAVDIITDYLLGRVTAELSKLT